MTANAEPPVLAPETVLSAPASPSPGDAPAASAPAPPGTEAHAQIGGIVPRPETRSPFVASGTERPGPGVERSGAGALVEVGAGSFLLSGPAESGIIGLSAFLFYEVSDSLALRPSLSVGVSSASLARSTWAAGRLDACTRVPGNYRVNQGLQLDLCGGVDAGFTYFASGAAAGEPATGRTLPYVDLGPSLALRGELGERSAVWLRGAAGINVVRASFEDTTAARVTAPLASLRVELGFSWGR